MVILGFCTLCMCFFFLLELNIIAEHDPEIIAAAGRNCERYTAFEDTCLRAEQNQLKSIFLAGAELADKQLILSGVELKGRVTGTLNIARETLRILGLEYDIQGIVGQRLDNGLLVGIVFGFGYDRISTALLAMLTLENFGQGDSHERHGDNTRYQLF